MTHAATYALGIDFGSTTGKAVILDGAGTMIASAVSSKGAVSDLGVKAALEQVFAQAGITEAQIGRCVATGYGRRMLDIADRSITEITCHARGAVALEPTARMVIDIGGQDSKVIAVDETGLVTQFAMNDRCAAGTGKFLEVLARAVNIELEHMGPAALAAQGSVKITSMCATFAETEVIALLAEGCDKAVVLDGVHAAVANRIVGLVSRVGQRNPIVMTGGVAQNIAAVTHIEKVLGARLIIPSHPQIAGALGAALFALDDLRSEGASRRHADEKVEAEADALAAGGMPCAPACAGTPQPVRFAATNSPSAKTANTQAQGH
ncbi:MAG TPA: acyl-CoA dehydratase activase [Ramlibacter sp.]|nr:acyl-CoA dehydratase activase [Ramlibacter sp.]